MADFFDYECRSLGVNEEGTIEGRAIAYNTVDLLRTTFAAGAFSPIPTKLPMLFNHDASEVIGHWDNFQDRADGLYVRGKLNLELPKAQQIRSMLLHGDISGLSIRAIGMKSDRGPGGLRRFIGGTLIEISVVTIPAVPNSGISAVRSVSPDYSDLTRALKSAISTLRAKDTK